MRLVYFVLLIQLLLMLHGYLALNFVEMDDDYDQEDFFDDYDDENRMSNNKKKQNQLAGDNFSKDEYNILDFNLKNNFWTEFKPRFTKVRKGCFVNANKDKAIMKSKRYIQDELLDEKELKELLRILIKHMELNDLKRDSKKEFVTLLDLGDGKMMKRYKETGKDMLSQRKVNFTMPELQLIDKMMQNMREKIIEINNLDQIYLTGPAFFARIIGNGKDYNPKEDIKKYWRTHVDSDNSDRYDFSSLLYLSTYNDDFEGGSFEFDDNYDGLLSIGTKNTIVYPKFGRFITYSSARENPHRVNKVYKGIRYTITTFWTCEKLHEFKFLDESFINQNENENNKVEEDNVIMEDL